MANDEGTPGPSKPADAKPRKSGDAKKPPPSKVQWLPDGSCQQTASLLVSPTGIWTYESENEEALFRGLEQDSDRAAAIIAGSMIDVRLTSAIKHRFLRDSIVENKLFQPSGPLGSFSSKIDLSRLMGIISAVAYDDIHVIRDIRNSFAHDLRIRDFTTQSIRDRTMNLKMVDTHVVNIDPGLPNQFFVDLKPRAVPKIATWDLEKKKQDPRARYLLACSVITVGLALAEINVTVGELV